MTLSAKFALALSASALFSTTASAACYLVYAPDGQIVYRDAEPPVDMSRPLHQTVPSVMPGARLVFSADSYGCETPINRLAQGSAAAAGEASSSRPARADRG